MAAFDQRTIRRLLRRISLLHDQMIETERKELPGGIHHKHLDGARNLLHYVALRRHDIRALQKDLASVGLSSLGRAESHVIGTVNAVLNVLRRLAGVPTAPHVDLRRGSNKLRENADSLFGKAPHDRNVRIMVTMPGEAATDYGLINKLVLRGMNCMRINCAHDDEKTWTAMISNLRRAEKKHGKTCTIEIDLAGPKLRTGPVAPGPPVIKFKPKRDAFGKVVRPARIWLTSTERHMKAPADEDALIPVSERWLGRVERGAVIHFVDARSSRRQMVIRDKLEGGCWAEAAKTAYVTSGLRLTARNPDGKKHHGHVGKLNGAPQTLRLKPQDILLIMRKPGPGKPQSSKNAPAAIGVALPEFFTCVKRGQPIWFDDGNIGGKIESVKPDEVKVRIIHAREKGEELGGEKGINLPETDLRVRALSADDSKNLMFAAHHADIVGLSFVRSPEDVREVCAALRKIGKKDLAIMLKIETRAAFESLPQILMEAMKSRNVAIMIARGDLAVECGFPRLAELQEEILWIAEAAHLPVVWATQVLETLAKKGKPSRSEITDAAMGVRAECVMLNKGPYISDAVKALRDILVRMEAHQDKKTALLRKLKVASSFTPQNDRRQRRKPGK